MIKKSSVIYGLALSVTGFLAAALLNALIPITAPVEIVDYPVGSAFITINTAYRIVLYVLAALFLVLGLVSLRIPPAPFGRYLSARALYLLPAA